MSRRHQEPRTFINYNPAEEPKRIRLYHGFDNLRPFEVVIPKENYDSNGKLIPNGPSYYKHSGSDVATQKFLSTQFLFNSSYEFHPTHHIHFASGPTETSIYVTWRRVGLDETEDSPCFSYGTFVIRNGVGRYHYSSQDPKEENTYCVPLEPEIIGRILSLTDLNYARK